MCCLWGPIANVDVETINRGSVITIDRLLRDTVWIPSAQLLEGSEIVFGSHELRSGSRGMTVRTMIGAPTIREFARNRLPILPTFWTQ